METTTFKDVSEQWKAEKRQYVKLSSYATYANLLSRHLLPVKFQALRHSFATRCIEMGSDYKTVSDLLGHADVKTTLNLYVHPGMAQKKACVNALVG